MQGCLRHEVVSEFPLSDSLLPETFSFPITSDGSEPAWRTEALAGAQGLLRSVIGHAEPLSKFLGSGACALSTQESERSGAQRDQMKLTASTNPAIKKSPGQSSCRCPARSKCSTVRAADVTECFSICSFGDVSIAVTAGAVLLIQVRTPCSGLCTVLERNTGEIR